MFSIKESFKYGWEKFKENTPVSLLTTLFILGTNFLVSERGGRGIFFFNLALTVLLIITRIGYTKIFLRMHDGDKPEFTDIFKEYMIFFKYVAVLILFPLIVFGGLILLIIPGFIWAVRFSFASIIIVDKKIGPIMAIKESYAMTRGMFWKLVAFGLTIILVNILGFIALGIGLLVSVPVSTFAIVYVYRKIQDRIIPTTSPSITQ